MTITGPRVRDFTGPTGALPVEVVSDPLFELLLSIFVWTSHEDPESDADYAVGDEWFEGVRTSASPALLGLLEQSVGVEELWIATVGMALALPAPRTVASLVKTLRDADPIDLRFRLIVQECIHCPTDDRSLADRVAAGDPDALDAAASIEGCMMSPGLRRFLEMKPAATTDTIAATIERFATEVFGDGADVGDVLRRDADHKRLMARSMEPRQFVETATNGITFTMQPDVDGVVLIPSIVIRPWVTITEAGRRRVFCYPVAEEHLAADPDSPPSWLVGIYRALGDERRLRLLRILSEGPISLADITDRVDLAKSTVHHHLSVLRQAGLVRIALGADKEYSLRREAVPEVGRLLADFLTEPSLEGT